MDVNIIYDRLIQSLKLVASKSEIQKKSLPSFANITDEIALIFDEIYFMSFQLKGEIKISPKTFDMLSKLNNLFEVMSEDKSLWNLNSLDNNRLWEESRALALLILQELGEQYSTPEINFINWIK